MELIKGADTGSGLIPQILAISNQASAAIDRQHNSGDESVGH
jgi:hypothetical protein